MPPPATAVLPEMVELSINSTTSSMCIAPPSVADVLPDIVLRAMVRLAPDSAEIAPPPYNVPAVELEVNVESLMLIEHVLHSIQSAPPDPVAAFCVKAMFCRLSVPSPAG